ncbi:cbb3-type cytochrome c oxidase subunit 3 [Novosphingobium sp. 1949]|uniref:Cbb3-type cytochrome c oxidase subunit 3 n=1 Tax=Novosphingobium organovorum TaxID=2930092 RepID=A0ABT0BFM1_9SPHN|nr:cbb3-type cytochrome c oxidase subunit 3 [Novosphingobium organovorum]MCJ2183865.1 cbb3-type cytochrome c oxidase subunit 3 [Novosphingobium organovorum]
MSTHSTYDLLRHLADSWGLLAMMLVFVVLIAWPFRKGGRGRSDEAATMIFKDENDG